MVDGRTVGYIGSSSFNFKSGDISGTAANTQDDKMGPGTEYGRIPEKEEEQQNQSQFVDRSAQLRATLNSLAMMNVANVLNERKQAELSGKKGSELSRKIASEDKDEEFLDDFEENSDEDSEENDDSSDIFATDEDEDDEDIEEESKISDENELF